RQLERRLVRSRRVPDRGLFQGAARLRAVRRGGGGRGLIAGRLREPPDIGEIRKSGFVRAMMPAEQDTGRTTCIPWFPAIAWSTPASMGATAPSSVRSNG